MEDGKKDITSVGRYLSLLNEAIRVRNEKPNRLNEEMCNKYYKLYCDEHKKIFGCEPDTSLLKNFKNESNNNNLL